MVDVSHEPRWGRISEAAGEDPYLGSVFAAARVKAAQGTDYSAPDKVVTSVKHFAAYGQPEGGREYNTTDMSEQRLRNLYLPPFKAAIDAGADTAMCSFNAISGVPGCADHETETDILKGEWGFDGFVESDYTAVAELRACPPKNPDERPVRPRRRRRRPRRRAGRAQRGHGLRDGEHEHPRLRQAAAGAAPDLDGAPRRRGAADPAREVPRRALRAPLRRPGQGRRSGQLRDRRRPRQGARRRREVDGPAQERRPPTALAARPLEVDRRDRPAGQRQARHARAVVGPGQGRRTSCRCSTASTAQRPATRPSRRAARSSTRTRRTTRPRTSAAPTQRFAAAVTAAQGADQIVLALGESRGQSGEAAARSEIDLPGKQQELIDAIKRGRTSRSWWCSSTGAR